MNDKVKKLTLGLPMIALLLVEFIPINKKHDISFEHTLEQNVAYEYMNFPVITVSGTVSNLTSIKATGSSNLWPYFYGN